MVVPVYNVEPYLERCIQSILNQTYKNLAVILVDDGSTDKSGLICDEYEHRDERVIVIHKQNGGQSSARKAGAVIATGIYITSVDSDDWIENNMFEEKYRTEKGEAMPLSGKTKSSTYLSLRWTELQKKPSARLTQKIIRLPTKMTEEKLSGRCELFQQRKTADRVDNSGRVGEIL